MYELQQALNRRHFFGTAASGGATGIGVAALASLLARDASAAGGKSPFPNFAPRAQRVIYLFQSGGPPQMDLYDYKPHLNRVHKQEVPESVFNGQRLTGMTAGQSSFPVARSVFKFERCGQSGNLLNTQLMPHLKEVVDEICFIKSLHTEAINHDPAITFFQ